MSNEIWRSKFSRLWKDLVPATGQAKTVQGELVRAVGKLTDEAYRNGNINFDDGHRIQCEFIRSNLKDPAVFSQIEIQDIDGCVDRVLDAAHPDLNGSSSVYYRLAERVVTWCEAKPELIARKPDPKLHR